ncbi:response regulator [Pseudomonas sp. PS01301]|uniref:response regulator n=1 Tax=Pseudomonas sp. PS01301 TaxID=2991437 RepID=UPI00249C6E18|nr:response regulator [Pseudomonas sp. PS01301]
MFSRVLLVEDDEIVRPLIAEAISLLGLEVVECSNADEGLEALENIRVVLVVTDVRMPGSMDGLALAKLIWSRWAGLPVIIMSGDASLPAGMLPADALFLRKPCTLAALHGAIEDLLPCE